MTTDMTDSDVDLRALVALVREDERIERVLENAVEVQREELEGDRWHEYDHTGFDASDVGAQGWEFRKLRSLDVLLQTYDSNSSSHYRLAYEDDDGEYVHVHDEVEKALTLASEDAQQSAESGPVEHDLPDDEQVEALFSDVVGHEEKKMWIRRTIENDKQIHHLMYGEPGSGKSMILDDIAELPGSRRVVFSGNQTSAQGVVDTLVEERPRYLVVEEIEKGSKKDREALMTLCGQGYIQQTKGDNRSGDRVELDTIVFAAGNQREDITPPSLVDRFIEWEFEKYSQDEFRDVCRSVLPNEEDVDESMAETVADALYTQLGSTSVRDALDVAGLAENEDEVQRLVGALGGSR